MTGIVASNSQHKIKTEKQEQQVDNSENNSERPALSTVSPVELNRDINSNFNGDIKPTSFPVDTNTDSRYPTDSFFPGGTVNSVSNSRDIDCNTSDQVHDTDPVSNSSDPIESSPHQNSDTMNKHVTTNGSVGGSNRNLDNSSTSNSNSTNGVSNINNGATCNRELNGQKTSGEYLLILNVNISTHGESSEYNLTKNL